MKNESKIVDKPSNSKLSGEESGGASIELHHEEMEEILGTPPSVMLRAGSGLLFTLIVMLIAGSAFFPSEIKIKIPAMLDGGLPDMIATSPESGNIMYHRSEGNINLGDTVIVFESINGKIITVLADVSGYLEVNPLIEIKRHIHENDTIGFIWPVNQDTISCIIRLTSGLGKEVKKGNRVRVAIDDYPTDQYGVYETTIKYTSHYKASYHVYANLPLHMITTTGHYLYIRGYNHATVEIITHEKTIFHRLINPFKGLVKK